ncbi:ubiquitin carboxyl-terminal hydrolase MINDY-3-like isoform X2 [Acipenser ruthenus]|uniref:ubiquitin carboxyl-terminal hydrolase MINDY-3-like isoform X2 n=1 Tax=Acipenser ruthenus TaxID=7906 RepID=UPI0027418965|nr:ubiquitin carboxyl-terminal hydrolase MINDY-3-like isoform X2 [Acipenser ruthenus]
MAELNKEVIDLVWGRRTGNGVSDTVFCRWTQGFVFSETEPTALEQFQGGPCAVIAPVQAFLLKNVLFNCENSKWRECSATLAAEELGFERFHTIIHKRTLKTVGEMKEAILDLYDTWRNKFGVLLFLYSVILTKGIGNVKNEIEDSAEPLIDLIYGHGSQSLTNLLLTGYAVSNVWDGDRECSGMKLQGIHNQATVGFLTLMESLRYCKVGSFLKSPKFPIWILGSETHLTVFFAKEMLLVAPESPSEQARRIFQTFDPEDNGFIPDTLLEDVMKALDLVSEPEYVNLMKSKLDPEGLGIILQGPFLQEFFPDKNSVIPDSFPVYHYNGLKQSNHNEKVMYVEGTALVVGFEDPMVRTDDTPIKRCLQTKWPYIELLWTTDISPSLN